MADKPWQTKDAVYALSRILYDAFYTVQYLLQYYFILFENKLTINYTIMSF